LAGAQPGASVTPSSGGGAADKRNWVRFP
jgi:hypothetical protein